MASLDRPSTYEDARERLKYLREGSHRQSEEVIDIFEKFCDSFAIKLGDEVWVVYEQVFLAALDCGHSDIVEVCLAQLKNQFPKSDRVYGLTALELESRGCFSDAEKKYREILARSETNSLIQKRLVAVMRAQDKIPEAIKVLNEYLGNHMAEQEGWLELADLYLIELEYSRAAFCLEECIIANPHNPLFHLKLAEIKYSSGSPDNMEKSRSYFAQAVKLSPDSVRALFGFFLASMYVVNNNKQNLKIRKENFKYCEWSSNKLISLYEEKGNQKDAVELLKGMMEDMKLIFPN